MGQQWRPSAGVWATYQALSCAFIMLDGGIYAMIYPYPTFLFFVNSPIPKGFIQPFSYPGLIALISVPIIVVIETNCCNAAKNINEMLSYLPKAILYLVLALISVTQLTLVPAATFLLLTSMTLMVAAFTPEPAKTTMPR
ncbi:hypothetical protein SpCBS45565_g07764 [Spizellomyces sp. 'palustris']|nr:hypothetical protein SpCBS45565_g07764 [Spizellomyces sp. 'palustris']